MAMGENYRSQYDQAMGSLERARIRIEELVVEREHARGRIAKLEKEIAAWEAMFKATVRDAVQNDRETAARFGLFKP